MTLLLTLLEQSYKLQNLQQHYLYTPPFERDPCEKIQVKDSTSFLGSAVLPGIPVVMRVNSSSPDFLSKISNLLEKFGISPLPDFRKLLQMEYEWSPLKESFLFHSMMQRYK